MTYKVATANLPARKMTDLELAHGITAVLVDRPRYLAIQEVGPDRNNTLASTGRRRGYRLIRAKGGPPVLYDANVTEVTKARPFTLSRASFVGRIGGRKSTLPTNKATVAHFEDDALGRVVVIDAHLTAEVQSGGRYRTDKEHAPRVRRHKRECRRLSRKARRLIGKGHKVFVLLDGNYDRLTLPPLVSCWVGQKSQGTLGSRCVDIVFTEKPSEHVTTVRTGSDHKAVVSTYA